MSEQFDAAFEGALGAYEARESDARPESRTCELCPHPFDPHAVVATGTSATHGGIILCPECDCYATWSAPQLVGKIRPYEPSAEELFFIRLEVFS